MKPLTDQAENHVDDSFLRPFLTSPTSGRISLLDHEITTEQATLLRDRLTELINCNVAIDVAKGTLLSHETWWDTIKDQKVLTVDVDQSIFTDLQRLAKIGDNFEKTLVELMLFYAEQCALNIILQPDVMETRMSYYKYTAQLSHSLSHAQQVFPKVRVEQEPNSLRLGIFCRKDGTGIPKKSFIGNVIATLQSSPNHSVVIPLDELPQSYRSNFAMLKLQVKAHFTEWTVTTKKSKQVVNISITK